MNQFDFAVGLALVAFMAFGFYAGLLRSLASILGYIAATPIALAATSYVSPALADDSAPPWARNAVLFFVVLVLLGGLVGRQMQHGVSAVFGEKVDLVDRIVGALFGALRVGLAVLPMVILFDRYVPSDRQPQFLAGSKLRPYFSAAGQRGIRSLPGEVTVYLDKLNGRRS
jgi:membrane protein required for colicin V production